MKKDHLKKIAVFGSTGSIGTQTLSVVQELGYEITALAANNNVTLLEEQIREFHPKAVVVFEEKNALDLKVRIRDLDTDIFIGESGLCSLASEFEGEILVNALVGTIGLKPTLAAIEAGKSIALANKETLVSAGALVTEAVRQKGVQLYPVDSEHSAIFQCLQGYPNKIEKIILTASGGAFRGLKKKDMENISPEEACKHPNWSMGKKITVDSATLMNKGLEVIEAYWLFGVGLEQIEVLVHPQSIIHSMVEFEDGAVLAQLGIPDMRLPIQYALTYPERHKTGLPKLDLLKHNNLSFQEPDLESFPCLDLAYTALKKGSVYPAVLNAANECAVNLFLDKKIKFLDIPTLIEQAISTYTIKNRVGLDAILEADQWAREYVLSSTQLMR